MQETEGGQNVDKIKKNNQDRDEDLDLEGVHLLQQAE